MLLVGADDSGELELDWKGEAETDDVSEASGELDSEDVRELSMTV